MTGAWSICFTKLSIGATENDAFVPHHPCPWQCMCRRSETERCIVEPQECPPFFDAIATTVTDPSASVLELAWEQMLFSSDLVASICPLPMQLVE